MPADETIATEQGASPENSVQHNARPVYGGAQEGLAPWLALQTALRFWWLLALLAALGGLAGWLFAQTRPPLYEAVTNFSVGIDFVQTGNMTQFEEDVAINKIGDLLNSNLVVDQVVAQARAEGLVVDYQAIRRMTVAERKMNVLNLRVQSSDVALAERVAQVWVKVGWQVLRESYQHAVKAELLDRYLRGMETCLENAAAVEPAQPVCGNMNFAEVQKNLIDAGHTLNAERAASYGLFAGLRLGEEEAPVVSTSPVRYGQGETVLAGSLLGLLLGVITLQSGLLRRWLK